MNRRHVLAKLGLVPAVAVTAIAKSEPRSQIDAANEFKDKYNAWVILRQVAEPGLLNIKEEHAWEETMKAWELLKRLTHYK